MNTSLRQYQAEISGISCLICDQIVSIVDFCLYCWINLDYIPFYYPVSFAQCPVSWILLLESWILFLVPFVLILCDVCCSREASPPIPLPFSSRLQLPIFFIIRVHLPASSPVIDSKEVLTIDAAWRTAIGCQQETRIGDDSRNIFSSDSGCC